MIVPIETQNLTKYYGKSRGIEGVNLRVEEGEIFGFIGPNGAGKTTTIRTLLDLIFPTSGAARVFGLDAHHQSKEIKRSVGYLPSEDFYYKGMNARQLLTYSAQIHKIPSGSYRERMELFAEHLDLDLGSRIKNLSRGNRRKVSIIKSLLPGAKLLILDEPTSGLDPLMQTRFFELLKEEQRKGTTIFFSSHILSEVQKICTRVAIIRNGQIVRTDNIEALAREHVKKITFEIKAGQSIGDLGFEGISELEKNERSIRFLFSGTVETLLEHLVEHGIHKKLGDLFIERSTLDEIFMGYYGEEDEEGRS